MIPQHLWTYRARPARVIDGDTVALVVDLGFGIAKASADNHFRVLGVNCPERHGATRAVGDAAARFTEEWLGKPWCELGAHSDDWPLIIQTQRLKSGEARTFERWVAAIWRVSDGHNLADDLMVHGYATPVKP